MSSNSTLTQIKIIELSLNCFALGVIGLLPIIGLPTAILAMGQYRRVIRAQSGLWNPAERYLFWGALCARIGIWAFFVIPAVVLIITIFVNLL